MKRYGIREVKRLLGRTWRVFLPGMEYPTYHNTYEEAVWAMRLRGYHAG